jgi:hypothetical protein
MGLSEAAFFAAAERDQWRWLAYDAVRRAEEHGQTGRVVDG